MFIAPVNHAKGEPVSHTTRPIVTGSSVIALTFNGGVIMASDTLCSYGSMADFKYDSLYDL